MLLHRPSFLFDCFVKIWATYKHFWGQMVYRPPWQKIARTPMLAAAIKRYTSIFCPFTMVMGTMIRFGLR